MDDPDATSPARVIVADDHEWILNILTQVVRDTLPMADVIAVQDGQEALDAYRQGGCNFLVSDHLMPRMDGPTLVRLVRAQAPGLPIVMVSVKPEVKGEALAAGANWFLAKDQITEHLPGLLRQYVHGQKPPSEGG